MDNKYIQNLNPKLRTYEVLADAKISFGADKSITTLSKFATNFDRKNLPYWITVSGTDVDSIQEDYSP